MLSGCSADGSVLGSGPRGRGFKSRHSDQNKRIDLQVGPFVCVSRRGFEPGRARASGEGPVDLRAASVRARPKRERERLQPGQSPGVNPAPRTKRLEIVRISSLLRFLATFAGLLVFSREWR